MHCFSMGRHKKVCIHYFSIQGKTPPTSIFRIEYYRLNNTILKLLLGIQLRKVRDKKNVIFEKGVILGVKKII